MVHLTKLISFHHRASVSQILTLNVVYSLLLSRGSLFYVTIKPGQLHGSRENNTTNVFRARNMEEIQIRMIKKIYYDLLRIKADIKLLLFDVLKLVEYGSLMCSLCNSHSLTCLRFELFFPPPDYKCVFRVIEVG